jgi:hypothetical protein
MHAAHSSDVFFSAEPIGKFRFPSHRTMRDEMEIGSEYYRYTQGVDHVSEWYSALALRMATIKVMCVEAPDGFLVDEMDPLEDETVNLIGKIYVNFREQEDSFREKRKQKCKGTGEDTGRQPVVVVSATLQSAPT